MGLLLIIFIFFIGYYLVKTGSLRSSEAKGNWSHLFADMEHDPEDFYTLIEEILEEKQIPNVRTLRRMFKQGGVLSHQRVYLEVSRGDYIFHICAAPWGSGFFFSWWIRERLSDLDAILIMIPVIGPPIVKARQYKSYYKLDTDTMFRTSVQQAIMDAIDRLTESKGVRGLTELERKPDLRTLIN